MAIILSIETATKTSSIALHKDGALLASMDTHQEKSHSEYLTPSIKYLLEISGYKSIEIDAVAVSKGPGSYTGLRIGTSTAKGICYAVNAELIAVNTLESMAYGMIRTQHEDVLFCPMIDARRMEVYCLVANNNLEILEKTQAKIIDASSFAEFLEKKKVFFFGNGSAKCKSLLDHSENAIFLDEVFPSAAHIGALAWRSYQNSQFEDVAYFEPYYLKDFIAKKPSAKNLV
ncbi:MAG: tRNA (adenosine(37)-N6)-threonylcarbamoyltransferase complex dimerization subunit type 1 TsaB [Cytophagales bacterium]|nr:tRNA (adenosine(37)-N6)-threonylcarbamoyltransferase complex dimerization subunit type 1 TsaB [Cytophagales bacterium]